MQLKAMALCIFSQEKVMTRAKGPTCMSQPCPANSAEGNPALSVESPAPVEISLQLLPNKARIVAKLSPVDHDYDEQLDYDHL